MSITLAQLQQLIRDLYGAKDHRRGIEGTFMWFMEEVGELATALRKNDRPECLTEFADVLAWLVTLANGMGIDLDEAIKSKYGRGCPGCLQVPCICNLAEKP
jgi:NTP pyrophosphatase (non-canonical NTP hydrolase)